jgi:arsenite methyltransferase
LRLANPFLQEAPFVKEIWMKAHLGIVALLISQALAPAQNRPMTMEEMHKLHQDSKAYMAMLDDPARDAYQKPHEVVMSLGIKEGETIADIGAGSGYFAFRFTHHVGDSGRVYAVDINPDMIVRMNQRIRDMKVKNMVTVLSTPDDPLLMDNSIDRFFLCEVWHHIQDKTKYLGLMKKMLKPAGQVIMIDFQKKDLPLGPPDEMKIAREDVIKEMEASGFQLQKENTFLPYHYFLVFTVKS